MITRFSKALAGAVLVLGLVSGPAACSARAAAPATAPQAATAPPPTPLVPPAPSPAPATAVAQAAAPAQPDASADVTLTPCRYAVGPPAALPPPESGPVLWQVELCFPKQNNEPFVDVESYLFYVKLQLRRSEPSKGVWIPFTDALEQTARDDFKALMATNFLEDMIVRVSDVTFTNGVVGKIVSYEMEERARVKIITYEGSKQMDRSKLEEQLRDRNLAIAADSMLDERKIAQVKGVVRDMMMEKGFNPEVTHEVVPVPGSTKTVNLTFHIAEGRKIKIRQVDFVNNQAMSDNTLKRQLKNNKQTHMFSWATGGGTWNAASFDEDAERVRQYYQNRGYAGATVGQPNIKVLEDTKDGKTQWVAVQVPVTEGARYTFGKLDFDGNTRFKSEGLATLYEIKPGEVYSRKKLVEGIQKSQDLYGSMGFMEFTALPDLQRSDSATNPEMALAALVPPALAPSPTSAAAATPHVDVTIRVTEGEQFLVRRITFAGNSTTRDPVIRRELGGLLEVNPFDTRALKESVRRLNQLGYFKEIEGSEKDVKVDKTAGSRSLVDVTMKLEEQNRNQLTFGAGVSQYEGFFGQLSFQTANFLGRGETFTTSLQVGARAQNFQLGFTKPYLFDTNMTGGVDIHKRALRYVGYYTQRTQGGSVMVGTPIGGWTKLYLTYSYEQVRITDLNEALFNNNCIYTLEGCGTISPSDLSQLTPSQVEALARNPWLYDSLLLGQGGSRIISKVTPALIKSTVCCHPIFPSSGRKYTASVDLAVLGGNTQYYKPRLEGIFYFPHTSRTTLGLRGQVEYIQPRDGNVAALPVFERLFLGGEYSVRGFDIRSIGPTIPNSLVVLGGNKSLLFNAEYSIRIADPVRVIVFYDAGQVRDFGDPFSLEQDVTRYVVPAPPPLIGFFPNNLVDPTAPGITTEVIGQTSAFKTSTGVELRFFMPVLNVPFRLIYAWNPQRAGVLTNNLQPTKERVFKFSVGTTF